MSVASHAEKFAAPRTDAAGRIALIGLSLAEMQAAMAADNLPGFRAKQVWHWIYRRGVTDFESMANLPKDMRATLQQLRKRKKPLSPKGGL